METDTYIARTLEVLAAATKRFTALHAVKHTPIGLRRLRWTAEAVEETVTALTRILNDIPVI